MDKLKTTFYLLTNITFLLVITAGLAFGIGFAFVAGELWGSLGQQKICNVEIHDLESIIEAQNEQVAVQSENSDTYCAEGQNGCINCKENPDNWICENMRALEATEAPVSEEEPEMYDLTSKEDIQAYIVAQSEIMGLDSDLSLRIAGCESYPEFYNTCHCISGHPGNGTCVEDCRQGIGIFKITQSTFNETVGRMIDTFDYGIFDIKFDNCEEEYEDDPFIRQRCDVANSPHNPKDNIDVALWLMKQGEYWRWDQSRVCWDK